MNWTDVIKPPPERMLRQFGVLCLVVFGALAGWRAWGGVTDGWTIGLAVAAVVLGGLGLTVPAALRPIYQAWMVVAFPIGWVVSKVVLGAMLYLVFTPVALVFRLIGRDVLRVRRPGDASYWTNKPSARSGAEYFRQY